MNLIRIYECLCDETRLRILHLLHQTPLCVCHFQDVLKEPQVKISKHLLYLKRQGLVESVKHQNWRIYKLPDQRSYALESHLKCLQDCIRENKLFREDLKRLRMVTAEASAIVAQCCEPIPGKSRKTKTACC